MLVGYGMWLVRICASRRGRGRARRKKGKEDLKKTTFLFPAARLGEEDHCHLKTAPFCDSFFFFFFFKERNQFRSNLKMGYDSCPLFTMLTEQRLCIVSFVKINKTELLILIFSKLGWLEALSSQQFFSTRN